MSALRSFRFVVPVLALGLIGWAQSSARAEDVAVAKGTITGKVTEESGTPAANVHIRLVVAKGHKKGKETAAPDAKEKKGKHEAVAETTTDKAGAFTLTDVTAGEYALVAQEKGSSAREKVDVTAGKTSDVTLTLKANADGGGKKKHNKAN